MKNILKFLDISMEINVFVDDRVDNKVVFCYSFASGTALPKAARSLNSWDQAKLSLQRSVTLCL